MGPNKFQTLWFSSLLLGASLLAIWKGGQVLWRREIDNPFLTLRGGRAVALGAGAVVVGVVGVVMAVLEGLKLRV